MAYRLSGHVGTGAAAYLHVYAQALCPGPQINSSECVIRWIRSGVSGTLQPSVYGGLSRKLSFCVNMF